MRPTSLKRYAYLSIAAALSTILLKGVAWWLTGSVGLLSDALESFVNLAGALMALAMLSLAETPADDTPGVGTEARQSRMTFGFPPREEFHNRGVETRSHGAIDAQNDL